MKTNAAQVYDLIQRKASSNEFIQGVSGLLGFPWTLVADAGVVITHYGTMFNSIRAIYGRGPVSAEVIRPLIEGCKTELFADILMDKLIGQIPVIGIAANVMCAKTMTWRLGLLFGVLSSRGEIITAPNAKNAMKMIRTLFPQRNMFRFAVPSIRTVELLLDKMEDCTQCEFGEKVNTVLQAL